MSAPRDTFLLRLLTGELDPESEEALRVFMEDPEVRAEFAELQELEREVLGAADERRAILELASQATDTPGEDAVASLVEEHFRQAAHSRAPTSSPAPNPASRWRLPLAVAAGITLLLWVSQFGSSEPKEPGPVMGVGLTDLYPQGSVESFDEFRWSFGAQPNHYYEVYVYDAEDRDRLSSLSRARNLEEPQWSPDPEMSATWPREIQWEVRVYSGAQLEATASATASRR